MISIKRIVKNVLIWGIAGGTSVFIAACYGVPMAFESFGTWFIKVKASNNEPIKGLKITALETFRNAPPETVGVETTDSLGSVSFHLVTNDSDNHKDFIVEIKDVDSTENGSYKDTVVVKNSVNETEVTLP